MSSNNRRGALRQDTINAEKAVDKSADEAPQDSAGVDEADAAPVDRGTHEFIPEVGDGPQPGPAVERESAYTAEEMNAMQHSSRTRDLDDELRREREENDARLDRGSAGDDERMMDLLRAQLQTKLPDPPKKPGWHRLYVSTTNKVTPPEFFLRLGYRPVAMADWPGWENFAERGTGKFSNCIAVQEMVLFEIPEERYQQFMRILHHKSPAEEEEMLRNSIENKFGDERAEIREIGSGTDRLGRQRVRPPVFN